MPTVGWGRGASAASTCLWEGALEEPPSVLSLEPGLSLLREGQPAGPKSEMSSWPWSRWTTLVLWTI